MERKKNLRRVRLLVTAQTAHNLERLAQMGRCDPGRVVDKVNDAEGGREGGLGHKLVRDRMVALRGERECFPEGRNA